MQNNQMNMFNNINNNLFQQMMNQNIINKPRELQRKNITLIFRAQFNGETPIHVSCFTDEKISEVINKYKNMAHIELNSIELRFIYNSRLLNPKKTVEESELINGSVICVVKIITDKGA